MEPEVAVRGFLPDSSVRVQQYGCSSTLCVGAAVHFVRVQQYTDVLVTHMAVVEYGMDKH